jgi:putative transposase
MRKIKFENNKFYHVFNRGANKASIFFSDDDKKRFLWSLKVFNDANATFAVVRLNENLGAGLLEKDKLVDILCLVLMPNHFHLLLRQVRDDGISKFMHKLGTSYANYINLKYEHSGTLFQGRYKAIEVESDEQLKHLSRYIHLNPVELIEPHWKEKGIKNLKNVRNYLQNYKWSSYGIYSMETNPIIGGILTENNLIKELVPIEKYREFTEEWLIKNEEAILGAGLLE